MLKRSHDMREAPGSRLPVPSGLAWPPCAKRPAEAVSAYRPVFCQELVEGRYAVC